MGIARKLGVCALCGSAAFAQHVVGARAGTVQFMRGDVTIDGRPLTATPLVFPMLKAGQTVETGKGRVEILLGPAVFVRLAENGALRMRNTDLEDTDVELLKGTALVEVVDRTKGDMLELRAGRTQTELRKIGLYRFDLDQGALRVYGGEAEIRSGDDVVRAGSHKIIRLDGSQAMSSFPPKQADAFQKWAARRSFYLFASSQEARRHRTNWETTASGWSWNRDFQIRLFSPIVAREYQAEQAREAPQKRGF